MTTTEEKQMGRFSIEVDLTNNGDLIRAESGVIPPEGIRRVRLRGVVDSGATRLVLPEAIVKQLGLEISGNAGVRYADGRRATRDIAQNIRLSYAGRSSVFSAVVEPGRESALIGAIVLEELDFLIDCIGQRLVPRDPNQIISEAE